MAKQYSINIVDGVGTEDILNDTYSVTASVNGYDNTTISPASIQVTDNTTSYAFTISATGSLTIHVSEDGTSTGTAVTGATFYRADSTGQTYGTAVTTDSNGNATLSNLPYATTDAPTVYYIQTASDGNHNFNSTVQSIQLTTQTQTVEVENSLPIEKTLNLTDANYTNLVVDSGTINLG